MASSRAMTQPAAAARVTSAPAPAAAAAAAASHPHQLQQQQGSATPTQARHKRRRQKKGRSRQKKKSAVAAGGVRPATSPASTSSSSSSGGDVGDVGGAPHPRLSLTEAVRLMRTVDDAVEVLRLSGNLKQIEPSRHVKTDRRVFAHATDQALVFIRSRAATSAQLKLHHYNKAFIFINHERLYHHAMSLWQVMKRQLIAEQQQQQQISSRSPLIGRVAEHLTSVIVHSLSIGTGPDCAAAEFEWIRHSDRARQFEIDEACFTPVLKAFVDCKPADLPRARAFFESIPVKNAHTYCIMVNALIASRQMDEARVMSSRMRNSGVQLDAVSVGTHLKLVLTVALEVTHGSAGHIALLREAEEWWRLTKAKPAQLLNGGLICAMMKLYRVADRNNFPRQAAILDEALALETSQTRDGITPPVYVDGRCMGQFVHSLSLSSNPASWSQVAAKYSRLMIEGAEAARTACPVNNRRNFTANHRAKLTEVDNPVLGAFLKFFQRSGQHDELLRLWSTVTPMHKRDNPHSFNVMLNYCASVERTDFAERLMVEFEALEAKWDVFIFSAWINCYVKSGDVAAVERIWQRMLNTQVRPDSDLYARRLKAYITARRPEAIDRVLKEMHTAGVGGTPITLHAKDYLELIKRSAATGQREVIPRWRRMAATVGVKLP